MHRFLSRVAVHAACAAALLLCASPASAAVGMVMLPAGDSNGPVTVFYPTDAPASPIAFGPLTLTVAPDAAMAEGNGRLVVISHGSGGSASTYADLATSLVSAGFVVAAPEHRGDNWHDGADAGPASWTIRPAEISHAIDVVAHAPRFARLDFGHVGLYGMSAGGHAALSLAGGHWSPARFRDHCEAHLAEDFPACVGLATRLTGESSDETRKTVALQVIRARFADATDRVDRDPRIVAIVAAVPFAADFDPASLARPSVPLALATASGDRWLKPRFHASAVLALCAGCEHLVDVHGGHGAFLSPLPPVDGPAAPLLEDPPGYDRAAGTAAIDDAVVTFFRRHLAAGAS